MDPTNRPDPHHSPSPQATNWQIGRPPTNPSGVSHPLQAPGAAELLMGVWNTQIEPRSG